MNNLRRWLFSLLLAVGMAASLPAQADARDFPELFADATGLSKLVPAENSFAAGQTYYGPYGGTITIEAGQWLGNSGTISAVYTNFGLPYGWTYNGNWTYTGSVSPDGILDGTMVGRWSISGLNLGMGDIVYDLRAVFAGGMATLTLSFNYGNLPFSYTFNFSQVQMLSLLL